MTSATDTDPNSGLHERHSPWRTPGYAQHRLGPSLRGRSGVYGGGLDLQTEPARPGLRPYDSGIVDRSVSGLARLCARRARRLVTTTAENLPADVAAGASYAVRQAVHRTRSSPALAPEVVASGREFPGRGLLVTGKQGLYLLAEEGVLTRLLKRSTYGLTLLDGRWFAYQSVTRRYGRVISFVLEGQQLADLRTEIEWAGSFGHQMEAWEGGLYLADTGSNRVTRFERAASGWRVEDRAYPNGYAWRGRRSRNYVHLNSLFIDDEHIYVLYHNLTQHTGLRSQVALLDRSLKVRDLVTLHAGCAHNIVPSQEGLIYCDSLGGGLVLGDVRAEGVAMFTRGVALDAETVLFGGSHFASRENRHRLDAKIFAYDRALRRIVSEVTVPRIGGIFELRFVEGTDLGRSESRREALTCVA